MHDIPDHLSALVHSILSFLGLNPQFRNVDFDGCFLCFQLFSILLRLRAYYVEHQ